MQWRYDPSLDPNPDKVSAARRYAHEFAPLGWDVYLRALINGMCPCRCTLSTTHYQDASP